MIVKIKLVSLTANRHYVFSVSGDALTKVYDIVPRKTGFPPFLHWLIFINNADNYLMYIK